MTSPILQHPYAGMFTSRAASTKRASSWDRTGANRDWFVIQPDTTAVLLETEGPGCITHIYCAMVMPDIRDYRNAIMRCYWDGNEMPAVEVPLGDFFGVAHGRVRELSSALSAVNPGCGSTHGLNCYLPMPFNNGAKVTLENRGNAPLGGPHEAFWYHVDYETYAQPLPTEVDRFHACFRQERPTQPAGEEQNRTLHDGVNLDGQDNYVALDVAGAGRMVGLLLQIENVQGDIWYGEGDDMVFIDGEEWPPSIHGTGTEEIFGGGACPSKEYASHYSGFHQIESPDFAGLVAMYRWYVTDPIHFQKSIRWTLEHGHANNFQNIYRSVAYWYQQPQAELPQLPVAEELLPPLDEHYEEARAKLYDLVKACGEDVDPQRSLTNLLRAARAGDDLYTGHSKRALDALDQFSLTLEDPPT